MKEGAAPGTIQAIGEAVAGLATGLGLPEVNAVLNEVTGGKVASLEEVLGVGDVEVALGLKGV